MFNGTTIHLILNLLWVRTIICLWMIFSKAWRHCWEALIPIWNVYVYFNIAGRKNWFWVFFIMPILLIISLVLQSPWDSWDNKVLIEVALWFIGILMYIIPLVTSILVQFWLAKKFGKWVGFWFWLLFLNPIFIGILAFDDSTYNENNIKKSE